MVSDSTDCVVGWGSPHILITRWPRKAHQVSFGRVVGISANWLPILHFSLLRLRTIRPTSSSGALNRPCRSRLRCVHAGADRMPFQHHDHATLLPSPGKRNRASLQQIRSREYKGPARLKICFFDCPIVNMLLCFARTRCKNIFRW
jgi:hypothetical protein